MAVFWAGVHFKEYAKIVKVIFSRNLIILFSNTVSSAKDLNYLVATSAMDEARDGPGMAHGATK